jgi:esterase/lipase superfamily enzyme
MIYASQIGPLLGRLDDESADVRTTAARALVTLSLIDAIESTLNAAVERVSSWDGVSELLSKNAYAPAKAPAEEVVDTSEDVIDWPVGSEPFGGPEQWLREFQSTDQADRRFEAALNLAAKEEPQYLTELLAELERGSLGFTLLDLARHSRLAFPPVTIALFTSIWQDETRRSDVRWIAYLLVQDPTYRRGTRKDRASAPDASELTEQAITMAGEFFASDSNQVSGYPFGTPDNEVAALSFLDAEQLALLVTILFQRCVEAPEEDQSYMIGNSAVGFASAMRSLYDPDVGALFEVYGLTRPEARAPRAEWYKTGDEDLFLGSARGHLPVSWQIAWVGSRAGIKQMVAAVSPALSSPDEFERLAAVEFLEDGFRYVTQVRPPYFGGGIGPELPGTRTRRIAVLSRREIVRKQAFVQVQVFYGTDRARTGSAAVSSFYGGDPSKSGLKYGTCEVTIPAGDQHLAGELESPSIWRLEFRPDPTKHIVLKAIHPCSQSRFCASLAQTLAGLPDNQKQALVFVHGYRVDFETAARRTAQMAYDLKIGAPVLFSWPSRGRLFGYGADERNAQLAAVPHLLEFLQLVADESGARTVHLIGHSMGTLALANALTKFLSRRQPGLTVREIVLAAPDIDATIFKQQIVPEICGRGPRITLYASRNDFALYASKALRGGYKRAGDVGDDLVVVPGIETIDTSAVNTTHMFGLFTEHSYVAENSEILHDLSEIVHHGAKPDSRYGLERRDHLGIPYWRLRPNKK